MNIVPTPRTRLGRNLHRAGWIFIILCGIGAAVAVIRSVSGSQPATRQDIVAVMRDIDPGCRREFGMLLQSRILARGVMSRNQITQAANEACGMVGDQLRAASPTEETVVPVE